MADLLSKISMLSYVLSVVLFLVALIFWFLFRIPDLIGELSGRKAKRSVEAIRKNNEKQGKKETKKEGFPRGTKTRHDTAIRNQEMATLRGPETAVLTEENVTMPLSDEEREAYADKMEMPLEIMEEIIWIHTEEVIGNKIDAI